MSQLKGFIEKLSGDTALMEMYMELADAERVISFAAEHGFELTKEELELHEQSASKRKRSEIGEEDLKNVAGGQGGAGHQCFFLPVVPTVRQVRSDGSLWIQCRSSCFGFAGIINCVCHGSTRCVHKMHRMDQVAGERLFFPHDMRFNNHSSPDKGVRA